MEDDNKDKRGVNPEAEIRELRAADRDEVVQRCKELYFNYFTPKEIATKMDVNYGTVKKWITRYGWSPERAEMEAESQTDAIKRRAIETTEIMRDGLVAIKETISKYQKAKSMDMKEALALSQLLTNIDKLMRLSEGKATHITEERTLKANLTASTVIDVLNPTQVDPFAISVKDQQDEDDEA